MPGSPDEVLIDCLECHGTGADRHDVVLDCAECEGTCVRRVPRNELVPTDCDVCWGAADDCAECGGEGTVEAPAHAVQSLWRRARGPEERQRAAAKRAFLVRLREARVRARAARAGFDVAGWDRARVIAVLARHLAAAELQIEVAS